VAAEVQSESHVAVQSIRRSMYGPAWFVFCAPTRCFVACGAGEACSVSLDRCLWALAEMGGMMGICWARTVQVEETCRAPLPIDLRWPGLLSRAKARRQALVRLR
jgi:hypothetical protein